MLIFIANKTIKNEKKEEEEQIEIIITQMKKILMTIY